MERLRIKVVTLCVSRPFRPENVVAWLETNSLSYCKSPSRGSPSKGRNPSRSQPAENRKPVRTTFIGGGPRGFVSEQQETGLRCRNGGTVLWGHDSGSQEISAFPHQRELSNEGCDMSGKKWKKDNNCCRSHRRRLAQWWGGPAKSEGLREASAVLREFQRGACDWREPDSEAGEAARSGMLRSGKTAQNARQGLRHGSDRGR